jgi:hypothetical protein
VVGLTKGQKARDAYDRSKAKLWVAAEGLDVLWAFKDHGVLPRCICKLGAPRAMNRDSQVTRARMGYKDMDGFVDGELIVDVPDPVSWCPTCGGFLRLYRRSERRRSLASAEYLDVPDWDLPGRAPRGAGIE